MRRFLGTMCALALLSGTAHAADDGAPHVFKPSGAWTADFGEDYCRLSRPFSDGTQQLTVAMERVEPVNKVRVVLIGDGVKVYRSANLFEYSLLPSGGGSRKGPFWRSETAEKRQFLSMGDVLMMPAPLGSDEVTVVQRSDYSRRGPTVPPPLGGPPDYSKPMPFPPYDRAAELKFAEGVNALAITGGVTEPVEIDTGGLKAPVDVLQKCADDLLTYWGLDAAKHQSMTRAAQPSKAPNYWLPSGTIEFGDFNKLGDSANQVRLLVSADGKPTACAVIRPSLEARTNDAICKALMAKAQFFPALDAQGQPMASYWVTSPYGLVPPFKT